jgi:hypothetical protein
MKFFLDKPTAAEIDRPCQRAYRVLAPPETHMRSLKKLGHLCDRWRARPAPRGCGRSHIIRNKRRSQNESISRNCCGGDQG